MKKILVLGYDSKGVQTLLMGSDAKQSEQIALVKEAKHNKFPKGIVRVEFVVGHVTMSAAEPKKLSTK